MNFKKDFPIFANNKWIVFLDSGASSQKPQSVIDSISHFLANDYANIHRWWYSLSERSEDLFEKSKQNVANFIWADSKEIIYGHNSTLCMNMLIQMLWSNNKIKKWDSVLLAINEHHANIVPWLILKKKYGIQIKYVSLDENYNLDMEDFKKKYTDDVKIISINHISNITWTINDLSQIKKILRKNTFWIVDGSQSVPHISIDIKEIGCDAFVFTGHKIMAMTGIWVLRMQRAHIQNLEPIRWWWDVIKSVKEQEFTRTDSAIKFEPWTPNIAWAISLFFAIEYIESIWWMWVIESHEYNLVSYFISKYDKFTSRFPDQINLIWKKSVQWRIGVFSIELKKNIWPRSLWDWLADENICVRVGWHCAHPFADYMNLEYGTVRVSLYLYNDETDIDKFFDSLRRFLIKFGDLPTDQDGLC